MHIPICFCKNLKGNFWESFLRTLSGEATAKIGELGRIGRENPDDTASASRVKNQISETLQEATDVLEQFELEIREAPKDRKYHISNPVRLTLRLRKMCV